MQNLSTYSTIDQKVKKYKRDYALEDVSTAFEYLALETLLNLNQDEILEAITDGSSDGGIDAIHIIDRDIHIFNFEYATTFKSCKKNYPESELNKVVLTMNRIMDQQITKEDVNAELWDKIKAIWQLFRKGPPNFKFYFCSNKEKPLAAARKRFQTALEVYNFGDFSYYDSEDILSKILEKKYRRIDGHLQFDGRQYFERSDGPIKGIVATVPAVELVNLVRDPDNNERIIEDVFNENVRVFLKLKNRINQSIYDTALSPKNFEFWYLNNGITIVCEECEYVPRAHSPVAKLKNLQIVNGGQTTHALFEAYLKDKKKIEDVYVIIRICETKKDYRISERISETTNSQNPIRSRDLHANDRIQRKLEDQFKNLGYYYERKKNQYQDQPKSKRVDNELLAQIYLAYYLDMPSEAKNQKVIVFGEKYDDIFDENVINAERMLVPYRVFLPLEQMKKEIQRKKRRKVAINEKEAFISRATFHLINSVKIIAEKEELDLDEKSEINRAIKRAIKFISKVVKPEAKKRGELYTHDKFFKEVPTNRLIRDHILSQY